MIDLLVGSLMADGGLESALNAAITAEIQVQPGRVPWQGDGLHTRPAGEEAANLLQEFLRTRSRTVGHIQTRSVAQSFLSVSGLVGSSTIQCTPFTCLSKWR